MDWREADRYNMGPWNAWLDLIPLEVEWGATTDPERLAAVLQEIRWRLAFETRH